MYSRAGTIRDDKTMKIITNEKGSGHTKQHCNQLQHKRLGKRHRSEFTVMLSGTSPNHCRQQTIEDKTNLLRTHWTKSIRLREKIRGVSWMDGSSQELTKKIQEGYRRIIWWNTSYIIKRHGVYDNLAWATPLASRRSPPVRIGSSCRCPVSSANTLQQERRRLPLSRRCSG